jgi:multidrug transporter EmrE-like cation transporter
MLIGSLFSLLAAVLFSAGNLIEKVAVGRMPPFSAKRVVRMARSLIGSRLWMIGFFVSLVGLAIQVLAFSRAPILVVQAIFGGGIVLLVVAARAFLHEPLHRTEGIGLAIAIPALILISVSLNGSADLVGTKGSALVVLAWSAATLGIAGLAYVGLHRRAVEMGFLYGLTSGLAYGVASLGTKGAATLVTRHGVVGSIPQILSSPYPYLFVVASSVGLFVFQSGLQRCRITVVGPVSSVASSVYVVVIGTFLFGERLPTDPSVLALRLIGFAGVLIGSCFLARAEPGARPIEATIDAPHLCLRSVEQGALLQEPSSKDAQRA